MKLFFGLGKNFLFKSALEHCVIPCLVIFDTFGVSGQKFGRFCHVIFFGFHTEFWICYFCGNREECSGFM